MYIPLNIPAGVYKNGTEYQSKGRWNASNLVRWYQNTIRPIGGWRKRSPNQLTGSARGILAWRDNSNLRWTTVGTHSKLYALNEGGTPYDITPTSFTVGIADADAKLGYGYGTYGTSSYGIARPDTGSYTPATTWSLDTYGQFLVACSNADGKLLEWQLNVATDAVAITNAPTSNSGLVVTEERFLFALGAGGNPRKVQWCDQEDNTVWTPSATNQAGDFDLTTLGSLMCGKRVRGATILFTDVDVHSATYIGPPYVYGFERIGTGCGVISRQSVAATDNSAIWMSKSGFWMFDGFVKPLPCDVGDYIFNNINYQQASKVYCVHNSMYGEVWWFYPSSASVENDSYVSYNYRENHWAIGSFGRTCGTDSGVFNKPMMVSSDSYVYDHETGFSYDSSVPFAESGPVELATGDRVINIVGLVPDENTLGDVKARFSTKFYPNATEYNYGPYTMNTPTSVRITGRQIAVKIEGNINTDWRVGTIRLDGKPGGMR